MYTYVSFFLSNVNKCLSIVQSFHQVLRNITFRQLWLTSFVLLLKLHVQEVTYLVQNVLWLQGVLCLRSDNSVLFDGALLINLLSFVPVHYVWLTKSGQDHSLLVDNILPQCTTFCIVLQCGIFEFSSKHGQHIRGKVMLYQRKLK